MLELSDIDFLEKRVTDELDHANIKNVVSTN